MGGGSGCGCGLIRGGEGYRGLDGGGGWRQVGGREGVGSWIEVEVGEAIEEEGVVVESDIGA